MTGGLTEGAESVSQQAPLTLAVLDTGVDPARPEFADCLLPGATFVAGTVSTDDDNGHGTEVAIVAAAVLRTVMDAAGIPFTARILPIKVADAQGHTNDLEVAEGIRWGVDQGARVLNISLGTEDIPEIRAAVAYAYERNAIMVAAAGNMAKTDPVYPAHYPQVIAAGGSDERNRRRPRIPYGAPNLVFAPSRAVVRSNGEERVYEVAGWTSLAAPAVSALAVLLLTANPSLTASQVMDAILQGAEPLNGQRRIDPKYGWGRISYERSLSIVRTMLNGPPNGTLPLVGDETRQTDRYNDSAGTL